ncbi:MAG: type IV pilin protein [Pyrinomonadaceae bacterium]
MLSKLRGFTLIELMITVAVVAILASIALPSYLEQVRKSKRAEGKSALLRAAQNMERYYTNNNTYNAPSLAAAGIPAYSGDSAAESSYTITLAGTATGFTLTATPASGFADPKCNVLTITNTGQKTESGSGTLADCW